MGLVKLRKLFGGGEKKGHRQAISLSMRKR